MIGESVPMKFSGGKEVAAQNVTPGHTILGIAGVTPRSMLVRNARCRKEPDIVALTAGGHTATFSPDTILFCERGRRRADEIRVNDRVRIFDDILHTVEVESLEHLEGGFRMFDFNCDGLASYLIAGGFLVR